MATFKIEASNVVMVNNTPTTVTETIHDTSSGDRDFRAVSASLSTEVNKSGTLTFTITPNNAAYSDISKLKTVIRVYMDNQLLWKGRPLDTSKDFLNRATIKCEGWLSVLMDSIVEPDIFDTISPGWKDTEEKPALTLTEMMTALISSHNTQMAANSGKQLALFIDFRDGEDEPTDPSRVPDAPNYQTTLDYIQSEIVSAFGGNLAVSDSTLYYSSDEVMAKEANRADQEIAFGSNLLDFTDYVDASEVYTTLIATGKDGIEVIASDGTALGLFGPIYRHQDFSDIDNEPDLQTAANAELAKNIAESTTITVSAVDLSLINDEYPTIKLGNYVHVSSPPHAINTWYPCTQIEYDLCDPSKTQYTLGVSPDTLTSKQTAMIKKVDNVPYNPSGEVHKYDIPYVIYDARIEVPPAPNGYITLYRAGTKVYLKFLVRALKKIAPDTNATIFVLADGEGQRDPTYAPVRIVEGVALDETTNIRYVLKVKGVVDQQTGIKDGGYIQIYNNEEIEPGDTLSGEITWDWTK